MYPLLTINSKKITENARAVVRRAKSSSVSITAVTKCFGGNVEIAKALLAGGITTLGDSRIHNLRNYKDLDCEKWLIRIPMLSECEEVVKYSDVSLNSELSTLEALNEFSRQQHKKHGVLLMIDVGDLREGWFLGDGVTHSDTLDKLAEESLAEILQTIEAILTMEHIEFKGIGANETCFGGTIPTPKTFHSFLILAKRIESEFHIPCPVISGGNSSAYHLMDTRTLPVGINNLRLGEVILFGHETAHNVSYPYLNQDNFILEVEIVELKEKPSQPVGIIGVDAFGHIPYFTDKGIRKRALCALGRQDTCIDHLIPVDNSITIEGASSDHMIVDITESDKTYHVGDLIRLKCDYISSLRMCTSDYVQKMVVTN